MESKKKIQKFIMSNSLNVVEKSIIITDPCYLAKKEDWGKSFDYELYRIGVPEFTDYIWTYTGQGDGTWEVIEINSILNRVEAEKFVNGYSKALRNLNPNKIDSICELENYMKKQSYLGRFSVDYGTFGVFYLDEVLKYNPNFLRDHGIWLYTIIENFTGTVQLQFKDGGFNILGVGNRTFCSL